MPNHCANHITFRGTEQDIALVRSLVLNPATSEDIEEAERGKPFVDFGVLLPMPPELNVSKRSSAFSDIQRAFALLDLHDTSLLPGGDGSNLTTLPLQVETDDARRLIAKAVAMGVWPKLYDALKQDAARLLGYDWMPERLQDKGRTVSLSGLIDYALADDGDGLSDQKTYLTNRAKFGHDDWYSWSCAVWGTKWNAYDGRIEERREGDIVTLICRFDTAWSPPQPWFETLLERLDGNLSEDFTVSGAAHDEGHGFYAEYSRDGIEEGECDGSLAHKAAYRLCYGRDLGEDDEEDEEEEGDASSSPSAMFVACLPDSGEPSKTITVPM